MTVAQLKWLAIFWPAVVVALFEYLRHTPLALSLVPMYAGNWLTTVLVLAATATVTRAIFTLLDRAQAEIQGKQQELAVLQERDRIARDLHDGISQSLFYANVKLAEAERHLAAGALPESAAALAEGRNAIRFSHDDLRQAIFNLKMADGAAKALPAALADYVEEFRRQTGIEVAFDPADASRLRLGPREEGELLRIVQEALWNARKHARPSRIEVGLRAAGAGQVEVWVADDGRGFTPAASNGNGRDRFGLTIMRQRAEALGGRLEIRSAPGEGTRVAVTLPAARGWTHSGGNGG